MQKRAKLMSDKEKNNEELQVADSINQASAITGLTDDALKRAKDAGCNAFRGSRVYIEELTDWIGDNPHILNLSPGEELDFKTKKIKYEMARFRFEQERGKYLDRAEMIQVLQAFQYELKGQLQQVLEVKIPVEGEGLSSTELRILGKAELDKLCAKMTTFEIGLVANDE